MVSLNVMDTNDNVEFNVELFDDCDMLMHMHYSDSVIFLGVSKWNRSLVFEKGNKENGPKLKAQPGKPGCYAIGGQVNVTQDFKGDFSIYVELRRSASRKRVSHLLLQDYQRAPAEPCINQRSNGCGGFGSCLYCNVCKSLGAATGVSAQLLKNGKSIDCEEGLSRGIHNNIELEFCVPPLKEILAAQGLSREILLSVVQSETGNTDQTINIFITIYIFKKDVSKLMQTQTKVIALYRRNKKSSNKNEPLPTNVYWSLPFNAMIKNERLFTACHIIHGRVRIE
ncbi:unnamed protein product [Thelazia callipaeda]|uniref:Cadherin domain-containing protein n=1 Tax=Thelazia callipaeda TaxID=103827 RepID=A0A158RC82_THECL|nr:unnamed protein product [Thelazia callipaeda]